MKAKKPENDLVRCRYRITGERSQEIIAIRKICEKKIAALTKEHGKNIKFSKVVDASTNPNGAPHV
jgi:hypothetical protein